MNEIDLGPVSGFTDLPAEVTVEGKAFYVMEHGGAYTLMSRRCPHAGATVELEDGELVCPMHGWTFESDTGRCHNVPSARLAQFEIVVKEDRLYALMP